MKFVGKFLDDKLEGEGREEWKDGTVFQGNYQNGLKNGQGKFIYVTCIPHNQILFENC